MKIDMSCCHRSDCEDVYCPGRITNDIDSQIEDIGLVAFCALIAGLSFAVLVFILIVWMILYPF